MKNISSTATLPINQFTIQVGRVDDDDDIIIIIIII